jgi:hypothetical protein
VGEEDRYSALSACREALLHKLKQCSEFVQQIFCCQQEGCAKTGQPDKNNLIVTCLALVRDAVELVETLL